MLRVSANRRSLIVTLPNLKPTKKVMIFTLPLNPSSNPAWILASAWILTTDSTLENCTLISLKWSQQRIHVPRKLYRQRNAGWLKHWFTIVYKFKRTWWSGMTGVTHSEVSKWEARSVQCGWMGDHSTKLPPPPLSKHNNVLEIQEGVSWI